MVSGNHNSHWLKYSSISFWTEPFLQDSWHCLGPAGSEINKKITQTNSLSLNSVFLPWPQCRLGSQKGCACVWVVRWMWDYSDYYHRFSCHLCDKVSKNLFPTSPTSYIMLGVSLVSYSMKSPLSAFLFHPTWVLARSHIFVIALTSILRDTNLNHPVTRFYLDCCMFFMSVYEKYIYTVHEAWSCTNSHVS